MKTTLKRIDTPFVFEFSNADGAICHLDASPEIGGKGKGFRPMELLTGALAGCIAIDVLLILEKQRISTDVFSIQTHAQRKDGTPSPFETIELIFKVDVTVNTARLEKNIQLVIEKYCSVSASLDSNIQITHQIIPT